MTPAGSGSPFPPHFFQREDASADRFFYESPRLVTHIDDATIEALTGLYRETLPPSSRVLDLMSSWVSHLPPEVEYARVAGLGMNADELRANPRLTDRAVRDLNAEPTLPYEDGSFDAVVCAVSVQYLTRPIEVFAEVSRVLAPGGLCLVSFSHRMFPTKAIAIWKALGVEDRVRLVATYLALAGGLGEPLVIDRSPAGADPLWAVAAQRAGD
ncbi:MAG: class I SAM-dependent methyltransferase [Dehalococcoidia bacterium]|nr:MAG: class I SAM-dependent methyltransferase [Dehalococcoidia bacterium]